MKSSPFSPMTILFSHFQDVTPYSQNSKLCSTNPHSPTYPPSKVNLGNNWYEWIVKKSACVWMREFGFGGDGRRNKLSFRTQKFWEILYLLNAERGLGTLLTVQFCLRLRCPWDQITAWFRISDNPGLV